MTNLLKRAVLAAVFTISALSALTAAQPAAALPIGRCIQVQKDPQVNRDTLFNRCQECRIAKVERTRPGSATGVPSMREFTLPGGTAQPLPFKGPGTTRITSETPCR